ncbi:MAG TPA: sigma-54 dependent transcriptional regulator, partial [Aggregicoccus sp.]|nr:sigma-54 dependent transcriptional regulator [Aggregicoccus sp.]
EDVENAIKAVANKPRRESAPAPTDDSDRLERELGLLTSPQMREIQSVIEQAARADVTVLICGETGVGKEIVARAIHAYSPRSRNAFVKVNCAAMPRDLLESELFGHERGAFTGAHQRRPGRFELADGGTIFLDEIGELHPALQAKLLHVLQDGEFSRVGGRANLKVDVRTICATNRDLAREVAANRFREDLFYRLNVIAVQLPPLRDRPEDVPLLAQHFLRMYAGKLKKKLTGFSPRAMEALTCNRWVGNVRELENVVERASVLTSHEVVDVDDLPPGFQDQPQAGSQVEVFSLSHLPYAQAKRLAMRAFERRYLTALLEKNNQNVSSAARAAGVDRSNFRRLLKQYEVAGRSMKLDGDDDSMDAAS